MSEARYFTLGPVAGSPFTRYAILERGRVVQITVSRPDGLEVDRPADVRMALQPFGSGPIAQAYFNNVRSAALSQSQKRVGEAGRRALAERRAQQAQIPGQRGEKLADARSSGAKALERLNAARRFRRAA